MQTIVATYKPYFDGEVFLEERNNTWNSPFLFNGKELDALRKSNKLDNFPKEKAIELLGPKKYGKITDTNVGEIMLEALKKDEVFNKLFDVVK